MSPEVYVGICEQILLYFLYNYISDRKRVKDRPRDGAPINYWGLNYLQCMGLGQAGVWDRNSILLSPGTQLLKNHQLFLRGQLSDKLWSRARGGEWTLVRDMGISMLDETPPQIDDHQHVRWQIRWFLQKYYYNKYRSANQKKCSNKILS